MFIICRFLKMFVSASSSLSLKAVAVQIYLVYLQIQLKFTVADVLHIVVVKVFPFAPGFIFSTV